MKLEVGQYIRFKDKREIEYIRKVIDGYQKGLYGCKVDIEANNVPYVSLKNVVKASFNIIDLIEAGDYVNGYEVEFIDKENKMIICYTATFEEKEIETVVTKEQFEQMKYKVEV